KLENAIRSVFERPPYFFEVQLARDYVYRPSLLDNIRQHVRHAHGFIADISELNANVMFELGAVMLPSDGRPVFTLRSQDAHQEVPVDIKENLRIDYGSLSDPVEEIVDAIALAFERDGRPTHEGMKSLLLERRKRFLSRRVLENLQVRLDAKGIES